MQKSKIKLFSENIQETSTSSAVTHHDEFTVIHSAKHHKKEPARIKEFPIPLSTITAKNDHSQATIATASTVDESGKSIETKTMKTETVYKPKENLSTINESEPTKVHQIKSSSSAASTTNKISTITSKPTASHATALKINFVIFLFTIFACFL